MIDINIDDFDAMLDAEFRGAKDRRKAAQAAATTQKTVAAQPAPVEPRVAATRVAADNEAEKAVAGEVSDIIKQALDEFRQVTESLVDSGCTKLAGEADRLAGAAVISMSGYSEEIKGDFLKTVTKPENLRINEFTEKYISALSGELKTAGNTASESLKKENQKLSEKIADLEKINSSLSAKLNFQYMRDMIIIGVFSSIVTITLAINLKRYL